MGSPQDNASHAHGPSVSCENQLHWKWKYAVLLDKLQVRKKVREIVNPLCCCCVLAPWTWWWWWLLLYSAILHSRADSLRLHVILHEWLAFYSAFLNIHWSGVLTVLARLVPHETAAVSAQVLCTPYNHAPYHFMQSHIRKVHACLAVTCHLHFRQNDPDLLRATAVTRVWNGYRK